MALTFYWNQHKAAALTEPLVTLKKIFLSAPNLLL